MTCSWIIVTVFWIINAKLMKDQWHSRELILINLWLIIDMLVNNHDSRELSVQNSWKTNDILVNYLRHACELLVTTSWLTIEKLVNWKVATSSITCDMLANYIITIFSWKLIQTCKQKFNTKTPKHSSTNPKITIKV